jgi:hypothetical protein
VDDIVIREKSLKVIDMFAACRYGLLMIWSLVYFKSFKNVISYDVRFFTETVLGFDSIDHCY